jgi:hypothetical protein
MLGFAGSTQPAISFVVLPVLILHSGLGRISWIPAFAGMTGIRVAFLREWRE